MAKKTKLDAEERRAHNALAGRLVAYRRYVAILARGGLLRPEQDEDLAEIVDTLHLPRWAVERDARAARAWQTADQPHRAVLFHDHPQLFEDCDTWVVAFLASRGRPLTVHNAATANEPDAP